MLDKLFKKLLDLEISENYTGKNSIPKGGKVLVNTSNDKLVIEIANSIEKKEP